MSASAFNKRAPSSFCSARGLAQAADRRNAHKANPAKVNE
jgi:hypothetical protein